MYSNLCFVVLFVLFFQFVIYWFSCWKRFWKIESVQSSCFWNSTMTIDVLKLIEILFSYERLNESSKNKKRNILLIYTFMNHAAECDSY